jgi:hypothetical protein
VVRVPIQPVEVTDLTALGHLADLLFAPAADVGTGRAPR